VTLTVGPAPNPIYLDTTSISSSGFPGDYSLMATVVGYGGSASPTGNLSFLDTNFGNKALATSPLGSSTVGLGWLVSQTPAASSNPTSEVTGDFNGDGIPDLALLGTGNTYGPPFSIAILFGKGDGTFTSGPTTQAPGSAQIVHMMAGDFNGDGKTDIVLLTDFLTMSQFRIPATRSMLLLLVRPVLQFSRWWPRRRNPRLLRRADLPPPLSISAPAAHTRER
jgi:FG-GAP-like repeat